MDLRELIDQLKELEETYGPGIEVRLAHQSSWPLEYRIAGVVDADPEDFDPTDHRPDEPVIYLVEGDQIGYAAKAIGDRL